MKSSLFKKSYNILEDKQLIDLGIMPFVQKAYAGESCHIPVIAYNPFNSPALHDIGINIERYIKGHLYPILNSDGTLAEVVVKLSDVTYRHQTEQLLSDNQLKFERLTKGLPGVIYEYEESGSNPNTFRYISQGCETMFGFSPEQVINDASILQTCIHTEDMDSYHKSMADSINGSKFGNGRGEL